MGSRHLLASARIYTGNASLACFLRVMTLPHTHSPITPNTAFSPGFRMSNSVHRPSVSPTRSSYSFLRLTPYVQPALRVPTTTHADASCAADGLGVSAGEQVHQRHAIDAAAHGCHLVREGAGHGHLRVGNGTLEAHVRDNLEGVRIPHLIVKEGRNDNIDVLVNTRRDKQSRIKRVPRQRGDHLAMTSRV